MEDPKIAFVGTARLAQIVLKQLIPTQFKPQLVITGHDKKSGRGQALKANLVKLEAEKRNIRTSYKPSDIDSSYDLAILEAYGHIIPKEILSRPKFGFINVHPSLLPKYRGPSPIQSALLAGEEKTGVTIIKLDEEVDHGPILFQKEVDVGKNDTHESLIEKLGNLGSEALISILPSFLEGRIQLMQQDHTKASFTEKISKQDGYIDLEKPPDPEKLDRMIRAYYPWPSVWTKLAHHSSLITIKFLPDNLIQPEGKRPMTIKGFLNGYPEAEDLIKNLF